ncbi:hypothetical protein OAO87_00010 [bacterium]|nr:hypothetical protein [bacterium]
MHQPSACLSAASSPGGGEDSSDQQAASQQAITDEAATEGHMNIDDLNRYMEELQAEHHPSTLQIRPSDDECDSQTLQEISRELEDAASRMKYDAGPTPQQHAGPKPQQHARSEQKSNVHAPLLEQMQRQLKALQTKQAELQQRYLDCSVEARKTGYLAAEISDIEQERSLREEMRKHEQKARGLSHILGTATAPAPITSITSQAKLKAALALNARDTSLHSLLQAAEELRSLDGMIHVLRTSAQQETVSHRGIHPVRNPDCEGEAPWDDEEPEDDFNPEYLNMIWEGEEPQDWAPEKAEPFFLTKSEGGVAYQSTAMELRLGATKEQIDKMAQAIVDSGAAWSAIDSKVLARLCPEAKIVPPDREFKDASNRRMRVKGSTKLWFQIGDLKLLTTVFVFEGLGAEFLLGVNSIRQHGLTISSRRQIIFSEADEATAGSQEPIRFERHQAPPDAHAVHTTQEDVVSDTDCACSAVKRSFDEALESTGNQDWQITCDKTECRLELIGPTGQLTEHRCFAIQPVGVTSSQKQGEPLPPSDDTWVALRALRNYVVKAGRKGQEIRLEYDRNFTGSVKLLEVASASEFISSTGLQTIRTQYHSSMNLHANTLVTNHSVMDVPVKKGTLVAWARPAEELAAAATGSSSIHLQQEVKPGTPLKLRVVAERRADGSTWRCIGDAPPGQEIEFADGPQRVEHGRRLQHADLAAALEAAASDSSDDLVRLPKDAPRTAAPLLMSHFIRATNGKYYSPAEELKFEDGGRPTTVEHLHALGFTLEKAIDPDSIPDKYGNYAPLSEAKKKLLYDVALRWSHVWSRDARTPELSRLVVLEIPTGDAAAIAQRPYPLPYQYLDAVRKEVQKLLDGGLIEPCISNWASPVLVRLKKDSKPDDIRLKLIIDFRRLNEVTVPDSAGLGDQEEILDGFGGDHRFCGICDAAGGFYQYLVHPLDRHKTAFCLPTSMGGTSFQWRVAPYGLTRNPAGYSRGMMYALKGLDSCTLAPDSEGRVSHGGSKSWIDDISLHADSLEGFADLFERILMRVAFAGMSLKATKCYLLHQKLEVLGFHVTPDGLIMQEDKLKDLEKRDHEGNLLAPRSEKEIRTFLGAIQFYRRFIPRLGLLAAPMNAMLKKMPPSDPRTQRGSPEHAKAWNEVKQSFEAILAFLRSDAVVAAPDLSDPLAEYVMCTDACDVAAGGVLLQ